LSGSYTEYLENGAFYQSWVSKGEVFRDYYI
jgi:hypothetical protein